MKRLKWILVIVALLVLNAGLVKGEEAITFNAPHIALETLKSWEHLEEFSQGNVMFYRNPDTEAEVRVGATLTGQILFPGMPFGMPAVVRYAYLADNKVLGYMLDNNASTYIIDPIDQKPADHAYLLDMFKKALAPKTFQISSDEDVCDCGCGMVECSCSSRTNNKIEI